ncbi:OLC1v1013935C1 [Oldenlandia corymbosa var. corymbosa]|uniref:OLC1v1013935C1 n=1 Tax=Oldenlandia corymbosa var. corymbosa TaxID=529605 RepID=A0AAV1DZW2_OLDCO|nr:OLC1v1013935C1 [Oldenlandia corymbosa var. corymbosa]
MATLFQSLLFFTIIAFIASLGSAQTEPVLDTDGNPVQVGVDYYVVPPAGNNTGGGGLGLQSSGNQTCPLDVVQVLEQNSYGLPLFFQSVNPNEKVVNLGVDQNVQFNASTICIMSTVWRLQFQSNEQMNLYYVTTGGVAGNPGRETLSNWFQVERFEDAYTFVYCPTVCDICRPVCGNIGVIVENGRRVLGINRSQPLKVTFKKV